MQSCCSAADWTPPRSWRLRRAKATSSNALSFSYGQRHSAELEAAKTIVARAGVARHVVADIDLRTFGGSALTSEIEVPKGRTDEEMGGDIPVTYVPARNTIF